MPCVLLLILVVVLSRNYLIAVSAGFAVLVVGMVALNLSDVGAFVPWVVPTLLSVDAKALERLGLEASAVTKAGAVYAVFTIAVVAGLMATLRRLPD